MGELVQFKPKKVHMCPDDWAEPFNPTLRELRLTIETLKDCYNDCLKQLDTAGVQSETELRKKLKHLECVYAVLMDYYIED